MAALLPTILFTSVAVAMAGVFLLARERLARSFVRRSTGGEDPAAIRKVARSYIVPGLGALALGVFGIYLLVSMLLRSWLG